MMTMNKTHGMTKTPEYRAWADMKDRCTNPNNKQYNDYGGRGIRVCEEWARSFMAFFESVGARPKKGKWVLDKIDNDGNYEPDNVRWATRVESELNKRSNRLVTIGGVTKHLTVWASEKEVDRGTLAYRLKIGVGEELLFTPKLSKPKGRKYGFASMSEEKRKAIAEAKGWKWRVNK